MNAVIQAIQSLFRKKKEEELPPIPPLYSANQPQPLKITPPSTVLNEPAPTPSATLQDQPVNLINAISDYFKPAPQPRIRDYVREIPLAAGQVAHQALQGMARTGVSVMKTLGDSYKPVEPKGKIAQWFLGKEPIYDIGTTSVKRGKRYSTKGIAGVKLPKPIAYPLAAGLTMGDAALNLPGVNIPLGGEGKTIEEEAKPLIKTSEELASIASQELKKGEGDAVRVPVADFLKNIINKKYIISEELLNKLDEQPLTGKNFSIERAGKYIEFIFDEGFKPIKDVVSKLKKSLPEAVKQTISPKEIAKPMSKTTFNKMFSKANQTLKSEEKLLTPNQYQKLQENLLSDYIKEEGSRPLKEGAFNKMFSQADESLLKKEGMLTTNPELTASRSTSKTAFDTAFTQADRDMYKEHRLISAKSWQKMMERVSRPDIDPAEKVNIIDYLFRTPDRVLQKIGLGREAEVLRQRYDAYQLAVKNGINWVVQMEKMVPDKESNVRIYRYLDGRQDLNNLTPVEAKVATMIRTKLNDFADRLHLPEGERISNYITHIFPKGVGTKSIDPELAKLISSRVPSSVWNPFLEQRFGKAGFIEDTWQSLSAYIKRSERKIYLDPILKDIAEKTNKGDLATIVDDSQYQYVKSFMAAVNMQPGNIEKFTDNLIQTIAGYRFTARPTYYLTHKAREWVFRGLLGLNVSTAIRNLTQGVNTYAELGEKYTIIGYKDMLQAIKEGDPEVYKVGVLADNIVQDSALTSANRFWRNVDEGLMYLFNQTEKINRMSAYYGGKAKALASGATEEEAIKIGKEVVRKTQFTYGSIDTPLLLRGPIAKLLLQFQSFTLKQAEFLGEKIAAKDVAGLLRFAGASLLISATIGKAIGMEPKDFLPLFRFGTPPTLKAPVEVKKAITGEKDIYGNVPDIPHRAAKVIDAALMYVPASGQLKKSYRGTTDYLRGYRQSPSGLVEHPVEQSIPNLLRAILTGSRYFPEDVAYRDREGKPLSINETIAFKILNDKDPKKAIALYDKIVKSKLVKQPLNQLTKERTQLKLLLGDPHATPEQKQAAYEQFKQHVIQAAEQMNAILGGETIKRNLLQKIMDKIFGKVQAAETDLQPAPTTSPLAIKTQKSKGLSPFLGISNIVSGTETQTPSNFVGIKDVVSQGGGGSSKKKKGKKKAAYKVKKTAIKYPKIKVVKTKRQKIKPIDKSRLKRLNRRPPLVARKKLKIRKKKIKRPLLKIRRYL